MKSWKMEFDVRANKIVEMLNYLGANQAIIDYIGGALQGMKEWFIDMKKQNGRRK